MRSYLLLLSLTLSFSLAAQAPYFQQALVYDIEAQLDDNSHQLHAHLRLAYTNNSPDTIFKMAFHLWPRAFFFRQDGFCEAKSCVVETPAFTLAAAKIGVHLTV